MEYANQCKSVHYIISADFFIKLIILPALAYSIPASLTVCSISGVVEGW